MNLYKMLPICFLMFFVACGDESSSFVAPANATNSESEMSSSSLSSTISITSSSSITSISSSWSAAIESSASSSSSQNVILSSSSSRHSGLDPESSSSMDSISSSSFQNDKSSSSVAVSSSSATLVVSSSSSVAISSSSTNSSSSSWSAAIGSSASSSSSQNVILSSSSSRHSGLDSESSSSMVSISSSSFQNDKSSSSVAASSSSVTHVMSSSSEAPTDPTKIFDIRVPDQKFLPCRDSIVSANYREDWIDTVAQSDLICSFKYDGDSGYVYVQNNPVSCRLTVGLISYEVHKAEFYVNGSKKEISDVKYHGGGNHRIFGLQFTYKGKVFKYDYSTMGMGGRPCQNMDCMKVLESDGKTVAQNGCGEDRSLPIVCRHAKENGTFDSFEDSFHVCESGVFDD